VLAARLDKILGDKTKRYELCKWLSGQASTKSMDRYVILATLDWLGGRRLESEPSREAKKEVHSCLTEATEASGIMDMFKKTKQTIQIKPIEEKVVMNNTAITPFGEIQKIGSVMVKSGFFADSKSEAQAIVKILAGQEVGLGPFASMTGIHIIQGKPELGSNLIATLIKNDPRYDYRVMSIDETGCVIRFYENDKQIGESSFSAADAKKAGTQNTGKFPRNMFFARALTNGAKWFVPGVFGGIPIYSTGEISGETQDGGADDEPVPTGEVIDGEFSDAAPADDIKKFRQWEDDTLNAIVDAGYAQHEINARGMLNLSVLPENVGDVTAASWAKYYRASRDSGEDTKAAAKIANERYTKAMEK